ncbi:MAG: ATP synthase F0 subunit B [Deltaproteobacteria bacterium]|nr:ATP synthase F0 subunit B [Deltaproteobacteria bacterium]
MTIRTPLVVLGLLLTLAGTASASDGGSAMRDFAWSWFNLILLLGVLFYFARKAVPGLMAVRRATVKNEIDQAANLLEEAESKMSEWQGKIEQLDQEVDQIRTDSLRLAESEKERILAQARQTAERIREEGKISVARELENARAELRTEVADLAIEVAREILAQQVNDADRAKLLDGFIQGLESGSTTEQRG